MIDLSLFGGIKALTYLKKKYQYLVIKKEALQRLFSKRFLQTNSSKLITTGIRLLEVYDDFNAEYLAAKSTKVITAKSIFSLKALLPILNSKLIAFFLQEAYNGLSLGGEITFSTTILSSIPLPVITSQIRITLENLSTHTAYTI